jgi:hypothetical protein
MHRDAGVPALFRGEVTVKTLHLQFSRVQAMRIGDGLDRLVVLLIAGDVRGSGLRHQVDRAEEQSSSQYDAENPALHDCTLHQSLRAAPAATASAASSSALTPGMYFNIQAIDKDNRARKTNTMNPMA